MKTTAKATSKKRLSVRIVDGVLTIQIGMGTLEKAIRYNTDLEAYDEESERYFHPRITDMNVFGKELIRAIEGEDGKGLNRVHLMLDEAVLAAIENGAEGMLTGDDQVYELQRKRRQSAEPTP